MAQFSTNSALPWVGSPVEPGTVGTGVTGKGVAVGAMSLRPPLRLATKATTSSIS